MEPNYHNHVLKTLYINRSFSNVLSKTFFMAFHDFDLNIPFESNEREFLFDLNQTPTREFTSSNNISIFPIHEDEDYSQMNPGFC